MNENKKRDLIQRMLALLVLVVVGLPASAVMAGEGESILITKEVLQAIYDLPGVIVVDVRKGKDWDASEYKIKGAVRHNTKDISWAKQYTKDKLLVFYCA